MTKNEFNKYQLKAIQLCYDYATTTEQSETVEMIWFTPEQLKKYTEYCIRQSSINPLKTE